MSAINKNFRFFTAILTVLSTVMSGISSNQSHGADDALTRGISSGLTRASVPFYHALKKAENTENLVCSPLSVGLIMGMIKSGAGGATAQEIGSVFKFPDESRELLRGLKAVQESVAQTPTLLANNLYGQVGFPFKSEFSQGLFEAFQAEPESLNFVDSAASARHINQWVSARSEKKIQKLFEEDAFSDLDRLVLVNVIYFKDDWLHKFPVAETEEQDFFTSETSSSVVKMMRLKDVRLPYAKLPELDAAVLQLPFKTQNLSMVIILPDSVSGIRDLESKIGANFPGLIHKLRPTKVDVSLPKFKLESSLDLKDPLTTMGMGRVFDPLGADLSGIFQTQVPQLHVSKVIQKAVIEINEDGAEAAAATGAGIRSRRAVEYPEEFRADHPFIFAIFQTPTSSGESDSNGSDPTVLFIGSLRNPAAPAAGPKTKDEL